MRPHSRSLALILAVAVCSSGSVRPAASRAESSRRQVAAPASSPSASVRHAVTASGDHGMVASDEPLATRVGLDVLRRGGTAVDAAIAVAFALAVTLPEAGNLGGGGFVVLHANGRTRALDFRETAPAAATRDMFLDEHGVPTNRSTVGHLAAGVPGTVAGLWDLHRQLGTKPWPELVQPAIDLASGGFHVSLDLAHALAGKKALARFAGSRALFLPGGRPPAPGERWNAPDLARTLRLIADRGRDGFYTGDTARLVEEEMRRGGGLITRHDLEAYEVRWRDPLVFTYRGRTVASMPPPSSGGIALALIAQELEAYDLRALGWHSAGSVHLQAEAMRRAFAVRNEVLGDPEFVKMDVPLLSSKAFARRLQASIDPDHATPSSAVSGRSGIAGEGRHTTHFSVADGRGNVVAMTTTLNSGFGSAVTVAGAGFLLNNEMDDFTSKPGFPNQFGLVVGEANAIVPGKRMLSAMAPTIVFDDKGQPLLVTGASGGPRIITTVFEMMSAILDHGMDVGAATAAPRFHHQHLPDELSLEKDGFDEATRQALARLGHHLAFFDVPAHGWTIAATIERRNGRWQGASDPRLHGLAEGY
jgi:gamma-glutamyltranspeptidase / glutathione hydrolase